MENLDFAMAELRDVLAAEHESAKTDGIPPILKIKFVGFNSGKQTKWLNLSREELIELLTYRDREDAKRRHPAFKG